MRLVGELEGLMLGETTKKRLRTFPTPQLQTPMQEKADSRQQTANSSYPSLADLDVVGTRQAKVDEGRRPVAPCNQLIDARQEAPSLRKGNVLTWWID
jgi:hypothetical protein